MNDYKKLSREWGSKRRKQDSRAAKSTLKKPTKEDLAGDDYKNQTRTCDNCLDLNPAGCTCENAEAKKPKRRLRLPGATVNHAIASYDTISPTGVLRLAKALKEAYEDLAEAEAQLVMEKIRVRMHHPPSNCEYCEFPLFESNRFWDGTSWVCDDCAEDDCAEETQQ